jgi:hypothetical protein
VPEGYVEAKIKQKLETTNFKVTRDTYPYRGTIFRFDMEPRWPLDPMDGTGG